MQIFFNNRNKARDFSKATGKKVHDLGSEAAKGKRWAHKIDRNK